jgi:hypothetical protein
MDIGHLNDPQALQILWQIGDGNFDLADPDLVPPHDSKDSACDRCDTHAGGGGLEERAPGRLKSRDVTPGEQREIQPDQAHGFHQRRALQPRGPPYRKMPLHALEFQKVSEHQQDAGDQCRRR